MKCPISHAEIVSALVSGKFRPFTDDDFMAFLDAAPGSVLWCPNEHLMVIVSPEGDRIAIEVHKQSIDGDNTVWLTQAEKFKKIVAPTGGVEVSPEDWEKM